MTIHTTLQSWREVERIIEGIERENVFLKKENKRFKNQLRGERQQMDIADYIRRPSAWSTSHR